MAPTTIEAILFDFGQTLVDSADGFRAAEKEAQDRLIDNLKIARRDEFLEDYRRMRRSFRAVRTIRENRSGRPSPSTTAAGRTRMSSSGGKKPIGKR